MLVILGGWVYSIKKCWPLFFAPGLTSCPCRFFLDKSGKDVSLIIVKRIKTASPEPNTILPVKDKARSCIIFHRRKLWK